MQADTKLQELERDLLLLLLSRDPKARLSRGFEVINAIDDVITRLGQPVQLPANSYLALVVLLGPNSPLTAAIMEQDESITALVLEPQRAFVENDLRTARVVRSLNSASDSYLLQGNRLVYEIVEEKEGSSTLGGAWNIAFCPHPKPIAYSDGENDQNILDRIPIKVFPVGTWKKNPALVQQGSLSWRPYLPTSDPAGAAYRRQERFHEFFRVTNQIELLFRDAEIFAYQLINDNSSGLIQEIVIEEVDRSRPVLKHAKIRGGLAAFVRGQLEEQKANGHLVYLGPEESLFVGRDVDEPECWTIKMLTNSQADFDWSDPGPDFLNPRPADLYEHLACSGRCR